MLDHQMVYVEKFARPERISLYYYVSRLTGRVINKTNFSDNAIIKTRILRVTLLTILRKKKI